MWYDHQRNLVKEITQQKEQGDWAKFENGWGDKIGGLHKVGG